jgi:hypothetical protein
MQRKNRYFLSAKRASLARSLAFSSRFATGDADEERDALRITAIDPVSCKRVIITRRLRGMTFMDPATITGLAATGVRLVLHFLAQRGEEAAKKAGEAVATKAGEDAYEAIKSRLAKGGSPDLLHQLQQNPTDTDLQAAVRVQLKQILTSDSDFAAALMKLVNSNSEHPHESISMTAADNAIQIGKIAGDVSIGTARDWKSDSNR